MQLRGLMRGRLANQSRILRNSDIANLLAAEADTAQQPLQKAYWRAARRAFLWPEEAYNLLRSNRSLTELSGVGPFLEKRIRRWIDSPPALPDVPAIRSGFISIPEAQAALANKPEWLSGIRGDLQMHSEWSDGPKPESSLAKPPRSPRKPRRPPILL